MFPGKMIAKTNNLAKILVKIKGNQNIFTKFVSLFHFVITV
jgi:hypothetical protein